MSHEIRERLANVSRGEQAAVAIVALALIAAPFLAGPVQTRLLITILLLAVFSTAYNLLYGYTGLLSFGHAMFIGVSAYVGAKVFRRLGTSDVMHGVFGDTTVLATFILAILLGTIGGMVLGVVIGWFCVQLEEIYFALLTLSFSMAIWAILQQDISGQLARRVGIERLFNTGGSDGLPVAFSLLGDVDLFGLQFKLVNINDYFAYYYIVLFISAITMYGLWRIIKSPFGTTCLAIRENRERAEALGIDTTYHSWITFIISGAFSGLVGVLLVPLNGAALPNMAHWTFSAIPVIMTVIGGPYAFFGPTVGAFAFEWLRELISQFPALEARWQLVFGIILLVMVLYFENGVVGGMKRLRARVFGESTPDAAADEEATFTDTDAGSTPDRVDD